MDKPQTRRLFFGVEIPEGIKQRLLWIQTPMAGARWQTPEQMHLTLVFLGNVSTGQLDDARNAARNLPVERFEASVTGIHCFGRPDRPRNLWAGVEPVDGLTELHEVLSQRLSLRGFNQDKRQFRPHITLARFGREAGSVQKLLDDHKDFQAGAFEVDRVTLYQSTQGPQGSVYTVRDHFSLC